MFVIMVLCALLWQIDQILYLNSIIAGHSRGEPIAPAATIFMFYIEEEI
jgi:hypothetical protein